MFLKINGFIPFNCNINHHCIQSDNQKHSKLLLAYSLFFTALLCIMVIILPLKAFSIVIINPKKLVVSLMFMLEISFSLFRTIVAYSFQIINRNNYLKLIDQTIVLINQLKAISHNFVLFDRIFEKCYLSRLCIIIAQMIFMGSIMYSYKIDLFEEKFVGREFTYLTICWFVYNTILKTSLISVYFGFCLLVAQFIRIINRNLKKIAKSIASVNVSKGIGRRAMKIQYYCNLSDECDKIKLILNGVLVFYTTINEFFSFQLIMSIADAFIEILSDVNIKIFSYFSTFQIYKNNENFLDF